jgi:hypothetical protein
MRKAGEGQAVLTVLLVAGGFTSLLALGCASGPPRSGFLSDYASFEETPPDAPIWEHLDPEGRRHEVDARIWRDIRYLGHLGDYDKVIIDPVVVKLNPQSEGVWVDPERLNQLADYMHAAYVTAVEDGYTVVEAPGERVMRLRMAITDIRPAYVYRTPDVDQRPAEAWANSRPAGATFEYEVVDSVTAQRLLATIVSIRRSYYDGFDSTEGRWSPVKRLIDRGARFFRVILDYTHQQE